jgi:nucleotide-binding universal stress UspA family protein
MNERILVPLDGSKTGEAALPVMEGLISKFSPELKVEITLLNVITGITHWVVAGEASAPVRYTEKEIEYIKKKAEEYLKKTGQRLKELEVTVKPRVEIGNAPDTILNVADEINANLIAMSTHGRSGFSALAFGSVTVKVLRGANMPVLTVRAEAVSEEPD